MPFSVCSLESRAMVTNYMRHSRPWSAGRRPGGVKPAQIYTTLERLERDGLVACISELGEDKAPERRIYALTDAGRAALRAWFATGVTPNPQRDAFFVKLMVALACGEADPLRLIQLQRAHLYQEMHDLITHREACDPQTEMAQILLFEKAIMHLEADLRWLEIAEQRLEEVRRQPFPEPQLRRRGRPSKDECDPTLPPQQAQAAP